MSKKSNRGKGGRSLPDNNGAIRKQKAAKYADRNFKADSSDNSSTVNGSCGVNGDELSCNCTESRKKAGEKNRQTQLEENTLTPNSDSLKNTEFAQRQTERNDLGSGENTPDEKADNISEIQGSEITTDLPEETSGITHDNSKRLHRAAMLRCAAESKVAESRREIFDDGASDKIPENVTEKVGEKALIKSENKADIPVSEKTAMSEDMARRYKKAAYIKEKMLNGSYGKSAPKEEQVQTADKFLSDNAGSTSDKDNLKKDYAVKNYTDRKQGQVGAYSEHRREEFPKNKSPDNGGKLTSVGIIQAAEDASEYASAIQSGNAAKAVVLPVKQLLEHKYGRSKAAKAMETAASCVKNSDSTGNAVTNTTAALAGNEVKNFLLDKAFGRTNKKDIQKELRKSKRYRFIKRESIPGREKGAFAKKRYCRQKLDEKRKSAKKFRQKSIYIRHHKNELLIAPKEQIKRFVGKKLSIKIAALAGLPSLVIFMFIITATVISSMFSWENPFTYSLAGKEDSEVNAQTSEEILDGYTLTVKNFLDVSQAYYYLEYGDWYGGTYDYPRAGDSLSFSEFFSSKCEYILASIREQFSNAISNAPNEQARAEIGRAMEQAITEALRQAQEGATEEYQGLIKSLDDRMTAEEKRQHYEVLQNSGANGTADTDEFDGKPIAGTNFFENTEIQSELSAEELMAMTALYKSLLLIQSGGSTEDGSDYEYNITPEDIMTFFEDTEYIPITAEVTHNHSCPGQNCRRLIQGDNASGYFWEYYCLADHDNLSGRIEPCKTKDELLEKIMEITEAEETGFDKKQCGKMFDEYMKYIREKLDISESGYRQFGSADNERAKEFYDILIDTDQGEIPNNYWNIQTPITSESEENSDE